MSDFGEQLAVNSNVALMFFFNSLLEEAEGLEPRKDDAMYVASILATFSQVSRYDESQIEIAYSDPGTILEKFYFQQNICVYDPSFFETGACQCLFWSGFFRDQIKGRYNMNLFHKLGTDLYYRASGLSRVRMKRETFTRMSEDFELWANICCSLRRSLEENSLAPIFRQS